MAHKITTQTSYSLLYIDSRPTPTLAAGVFIALRIFRFGEGLIFFYNTTSGVLYPEDSVIAAYIT
jgi:hypothetical protein